MPFMVCAMDWVVDLRNTFHENTAHGTHTHPCTDQNSTHSLHTVACPCRTLHLYVQYDTVSGVPTTELRICVDWCSVRTHLLCSYTADTNEAISEPALLNILQYCCACNQSKLDRRQLHCAGYVCSTRGSHPAESLLADSDSLPLQPLGCELKSHDPCHLGNGRYSQ